MQKNYYVAFLPFFYEKSIKKTLVEYNFVLQNTELFVFDNRLFNKSICINEKDFGYYGCSDGIIVVICTKW